MWRVVVSAYLYEIKALFCRLIGLLLLNEILEKKINNMAEVALLPE